MKKRVIIIVLDGVGVGALPDADRFNDENSSTLPHVATHTKNFSLPNLQKLGLGNIVEISGVSKNLQNTAAYGKMREVSPGKDSVTGHWEIAGLNVETEFQFFPNGFPKKMIEKFIELTGVPGVILNKAYSGTDAIRDFGEEHLKTKKLIIYTSADSVFQIAAHEKIYPKEELYRICEIARHKLFNPGQTIGRVIARPFLGTNKENFKRTTNRKDYAVSPPRDTILDILKTNSYGVTCVGKIEDLFNFKGMTKSFHSHSNEEGIDKTIEFLRTAEDGLIFTNLVDFDSLWGHRNDVAGFAKGLIYFDTKLPEIISSLSDDDILILTADHGCDPTFPGTDHTREYIPLIVYGKNCSSKNLGIRNSFADIAATIADYFSVEKPELGVSFLKEILKEN